MLHTTPIWTVRAGANGEVDHVFLQHNLLAIGWPAIGDLDTLPASRDGIRNALQRAYPDQKPGWYAGAAGMLYRFRYEMKGGDIAVYPSKRDRLIHVGIMGDAYRHDPSVDSHYCNLRPVSWRTAVPRTDFTQGALYELNSALSLFKVVNYASEIYKVLESDGTALIAQGTAPPTPEPDQTITATSVEIEENTRAYVLKTLSQELKGHPFADFVGHLLGTMGFRCTVSPPGADGGIDILAHKDELGFEPPIVKVQVKSTSGQIGAPDVQALYGTVQHGEFGLLVTLGFFTNQALNFARGKSNLRLVDGNQLVEHVLEHYEGFDGRYKGILPLRRVYVPAGLSD